MWVGVIGACFLVLWVRVLNPFFNDANFMGGGLVRSISTGLPTVNELAGMTPVAVSGVVNEAFTGFRVIGTPSPQIASTGLPGACAGCFTLPAPMPTATDYPWACHPTWDDACLDTWVKAGNNPTLWWDRWTPVAGVWTVVPTSTSTPMPWYKTLEPAAVRTAVAVELQRVIKLIYTYPVVIIP